MTCWRDAAACYGEDPVLFFPDLEDGRALYNRQVCRALTICMDCPVVIECLDYAMATDERHGVWGGMTEIERARLRGRKRAHG